MTLDPVLTLETDKHIDIFVQGIVTVPYLTVTHRPHRVLTTPDYQRIPTEI